MNVKTLLDELCKFVAEMIVYNGRHIGSPIKEFTATSKPGKELKKFIELLST